jgi:hypothetical protein
MSSRRFYLAAAGATTLALAAIALLGWWVPLTWVHVLVAAGAALPR